jgi:endonuclease/exonuclease/phosphatase family metal-dependent hydrolase
LPGGRFQLPAQAEAVLGSDHPHLSAVANDLAMLPHLPGAGDLMLFGWNREQPLSLQNEAGGHGGPGPNETSAFVVVPREAHAFTALPTPPRPRTLRAALLRVRERPLSVRRHHDETRPQYAAPRIAPSEHGFEICLRVMTYNVHGCRGMDGIIAPHRIARVIARERPDVICLQELDRVRARSGGVDQAHRIAQRLQREYLFHAVSELGDGHFGNAILSSLPLRLRRAAALPSSRAKQVLNLWDRGALHVALEVDGGEVHVINTHLSVFPSERTLQAEALVGPDWIASFPTDVPLILTGDFNASPASRTMSRLEARLKNAADPSEDGKDLRTWTGNLPLRRIDHVLINDAVQVRGVYVPRTPLSRVASDHLPLVADLVCRVPQRTAAGEELRAR